MSYLKCKDCKYFIEGIHLEKCALGHQTTKFGYGSPLYCNSFESTEYTCGQCSHFTEKGKCTRDGLFGMTAIMSFQKHYKNQPACEYFKPADNCFLTSAYVDYMGKPDDCAELTALRAFRDGYMMKTEEGRALVEEYYRIAPEIVKEINASPERDEYYDYIASVVEKCVVLIGQDRYAETLAEYRAMVLKLKEALLRRE